MNQEKRKLSILEMFGEPIITGGQESFVTTVLSGLNEEDYAIDCFTPFNADNSKLTELTECKFKGKIYSLGYDFKMNTDRTFLYKPVLSFLKEHSYDIVHIHTGSAAVMCVYSLAAKNAGIQRIICHSHSAGEAGGLRYRLNKFVTNLVLKYCKVEYLSCSYLAGKWKYSDDIVRAKMIVVPNGIDIEKFSFDIEQRYRLRKELGIKDRIVIGHVGRLCYQKNQQFLIEVLKELNKTDNTYSLLLVGDGEDGDILRDKAYELDVADNVIFAGNRPDVERYMSAMDIFAMPSRFEGLPIVAIEALTSGLRLILSDRIKTKELESFNDIVYLPINDPVIWARQIEKIMDSYNEAIMIDKRQEAYVSVKDKGYDMADTAKLIDSVYKCGFRKE